MAIFLNAIVREKTFDWGTILAVDVSAEELIKFANEHKNERGYVKFDIKRRQKESDKGGTHYIQLNEYAGTPKSDTKSAPAKGAAKPYPNTKKAAPEPEQEQPPF
jgi:hypothetical protein